MVFHPRIALEQPVVHGGVTCGFNVCSKPEQGVMLVECGFVRSWINRIALLADFVVVAAICRIPRVYLHPVESVTGHVQVSHVGSHLVCADQPVRVP